MSPLLQIRQMRLICHRTNGELFHRSLFSPASAVDCRKNHLLCPDFASFATTTSTRYFSSSNFASNIVTTVTDKLTQNEVVYTVQEKLITLHDISGLPYWAVIVTSTIAIRTLLIFPFAVHQQRVIAKINNIHKELERTAEKEVSAAVTRLAKEYEWDKKSLDTNYHAGMYDRREELYEKYKCFPSKAFILGFIQVPVWVIMSGAIYNINSMLPIRDAVATQAYLDLKATSWSIFTDLTVPDELYLLPVFITSINLIIFQLKRVSVFTEPNRLRNVASVIWHTFTLSSYAIIASAPKCITLYWLTSSFIGLLQNILFVLPKTRKILRIFPREGTERYPFKGMRKRLKSMYNFFKY